MAQLDFIFLFVTIILNASASLLIKKGASAIIGGAKFGQGSVLKMLAPSLNLFTISGLILLGLSFVMYIIVVSRVNVSIAQPMLALAYVIVAVGAYYFFGEQLAISQYFGIGIILFGVYLLAGGLGK